MIRALSDRTGMNCRMVPHLAVLTVGFARALVTWAVMLGRETIEAVPAMLKFLPHLTQR